MSFPMLWMQNHVDNTANIFEGGGKRLSKDPIHQSYNILKTYNYGLGSVFTLFSITKNKLNIIVIITNFH